MIKFAFDAKAERATKLAEEHAAALVKNITAQTQANLRNLIAQAVRSGLRTRDTAQAIHDTIGLNAQQGQAAMKYRDQLTSSGLDPQDVDDQVATYVDELLTERAETIARTEVMDALNDGQDEAWQQAQDEGLLTAGATKIWIGTPGECPDCEEMEGEIAPIGDDFDGGNPPLHPRCRCTTGIDEP